VAKVVFYRQCRLAKRAAVGALWQVSWIPDRFAVPGKVLRLRAGGRDWTDGWVVREVGRNRLAEGDLPDFHQMSKSHLRATGDAETAPKD
jgi:hypothetical protein